MTQFSKKGGGPLLHLGSLFSEIAKRFFVKKMQIADHLEVKDAKFEDGMLHINLKDVREKKVKTISVK